jgi:hypothetical protein
MLVGGETNFSFRLTLTSKIKLRRSRDAFALVADAANYKIKIKEMALYLRKVQLSTADLSSVNVESNKIDLVVFEIERIFPIAPFSASLSTQAMTRTDNKGFTARKKLTALSKSVQMMGKLHLNLFCQDKYLLNHVDLKIKLRRSRDAFALVADAANYKVQCIAVYTGNDESLWQLSQKHIVLNVIHVAGGYRVH